MTKARANRAHGTAWRMWDLHVHTPASIVQHYGGDSDQAWDRFIEELEALPEDMTVIGINDYWFLDGYKRVVKARKSGRLQNLEAIFPVIELRLEQFGGTAGDLSRVNLHVIFDPKLDPEVIEAQFINALQPKMKLAPGHSALDWSGVITRESLMELGSRIKASVPAERLSEYESDLTEGFNNLNVKLEDVQGALNAHYFRGRALIAIGKAEWRNIKWNNQSIAAKKNVINSADLVFTAYEDTSRWMADVEYLRESGVTHQLLDCSDAHHFSDSGQHTRLGACQTWLNTTPTLAGLSHALKEFERRVYVGLEPPTLQRIRRHPERFIERVRVGSDSEGENLFNHDLPLNPGFVAVVGNKGQGKSALLDCIALGGNSSRNGEFAFLSPKRFLNARNKKVAELYFTEIVWATGSVRKVHLNQPHDNSVPMLVEYLPQMFVERVCNLDPEAGDVDEFERELRTVLFTHIPDEERAGEKSFDALLTQTTQTSQADLNRLRADLWAAVSAYAEVASFRASNQASEVEARIKSKEADVKTAKDDRKAAETALAEIDAGGKEDEDLAKLMQDADKIGASLTALATKRSTNEQKQAEGRRRLAKMESLAHQATAIQDTVASLNREAELLLGGGASAEPYLELRVNAGRYEDWRTEEQESLTALGTELGQIDQDLRTQEQARQVNADKLASADSSRERVRQRVLQLSERVATLVGEDNDPESLAGLSALLQRIKDAPEEMDSARETIVLHSRRIHEALSAQMKAVQSLYSHASKFIAESEAVKNAGLEFNAELRVLPSWRRLTDLLDGRKNGDFPDWLAALSSRIEDTSWDQLQGQLAELFTRLEHERGDAAGVYRNPANALRNSTTIDDFLMSVFELSWLGVRFGLTGDGVPLSQLSPGQRGLVLALFYLVVDRRTTPLLLDQPEENLDNETIASKLVPAIHEAAGRRQTIVVTHNANLAIVGDADQIVHCQMKDGRFSVNSGSITELDVAKFAINVLEGTKPAFDNRRHKYEAFPELL